MSAAITEQQEHERYERQRRGGRHLPRERAFKNDRTIAEGVAAQPVAPTIAEFHQALDALESAPGDRSEREIRTVARKAGDILTQHGIKGYLATESEDAIIIAPVRGASKLNDVAYSLRRNVGGLELRFDPRALKVENTGALY